MLSDSSTPPIAWNPGERAALGPLARLTPSEWAEQHRILTREQSARPGPLRHANAPYLVGICNLCAMSGVEEIWIEKAAQVGVSEAIRNVIGWWAECEPDPVLLVLPDEKKGREVIGDRLVPLFTTTPILRRLHTGIKRDLKLSEIRLANGFVLRLGFSGSASALATHPARRVINDEVDKFQPFSGRESDPLSLARQRTKTFGSQRLIVNLSTPTTTDAMIHAGREAAPIQLRYYVPCPHCDHWQTLRFDQLKWSPADQGEGREDHAARIGDSRGAWYECEHCAGRIEQRDKPKTVRRGRWAVEAAVEQLGRLEPETRSGSVITAGWPVGNVVGLQINERPCLWVSWWETAAAFLLAQGDVGRLMDFRNGRMGEPELNQLFHAKPSVFAEKCAVEYRPGVVPAWGQRLLGTVDVQLDHVYVVIRAWGYAHQSRRVWHGKLPLPAGVESGWEELHHTLFNSQFPREGARPGGPEAQRREGEEAEAVGVDLVVIDAKYRTDEVYRFALRDPVRIRAAGGTYKPQAQYVTARRHDYRPMGQKHKPPVRVWLHIMDTPRLKDWLAGALASTITRPDSQGEMIAEDLWQLNSHCDDEYNKQMGSEHKVPGPRGAGARREVWVPVTSGAANHYWDCEYMQRAAAFLARVELLPSEKPPRRQGAKKTSHRGRRGRRGSRG